MDRIEDIIEKLEAYKSNIYRFMEAATIQAKDDIVDMNIYQMYDMGETRDGQEITPYYAPYTVELKKKKGQPTDRVTLRDTFAFQSSLWVQFYQDGFEIKASDKKTERLKAKYGDEILGLQDKMAQQLCETYYKPLLLSELKKAFSYD